MRPFIGLVKRTFGGGFVWPCRGQAKQTVEHLRHNRLAGGRVFPSGQLTLCVQRCMKTTDRSRSVKVMLQILRAVPQRLHGRTFAGFGNVCGLRDDIHFQATPKTAAQQGQVKLHFVGGNAQHLGHHVACQIGDLCRSPNLCATVFEPDGATQWLHGCVCQVGRAVLGVDLLG